MSQYICSRRLGLCGAHDAGFIGSAVRVALGPTHFSQSGHLSVWLRYMIDMFDIYGCLIYMVMGMVEIHG